jgi:hypothetical protein
MEDPSFTTTSSSPQDSLRAGEFPAVTEDVTILTGQNLVEGSVLGKITVGAVAAAAHAGNTGNGAFGAVTTGAGAKPGVYRVVCVEPGANVGTFAVEDPDGVNVGNAVVAVPFAGPINFTLADGAADFIVGDSFDVTVAAGTGKYKLAAAAAADGSQGACAILVRDTDASAGDKKASVYITGEFAKNKLVFGVGHTAVTVEASLKALNIYLRDVVAA